MFFSDWFEGMAKFQISNEKFKMKGNHCHSERSEESVWKSGTQMLSFALPAHTVSLATLGMTVSLCHQPAIRFSFFI
jgi:hypothetical protein